MNSFSASPYAHRRLDSDTATDWLRPGADDSRCVLCVCAGEEGRGCRPLTGRPPPYCPSSRPWTAAAAAAGSHQCGTASVFCAHLGISDRIGTVQTPYACKRAAPASAQNWIAVRAYLGRLKTLRYLRTHLSAAVPSATAAVPAAAPLTVSTAETINVNHWLPEFSPLISDVHKTPVGFGVSIVCALFQLRSTLCPKSRPRNGSHSK